jgi:mono/diheme cytochrome c family protein
MKPTSTLLAAGSTLVAGVFALVAFAGTSSNGTTPSRSAAERLEHGRYIVNQVGLCNDCHSPRNPDGSLIAGKELTGAPIPFTPSVPMPWMAAAPRIAGLPAGFTEEDTVHFLMTGERPNGRPDPLPPMPPYRLNREDAEAVAAYLHSLAPAEVTTTVN